MSINKSTLEWILLVTLFLFSFIHPITLLIFLFSLIFLFTQKEIGALKILILLTLRTFINPSLAVSITSFQSMKWMLIFASALLLWFGITKISKYELDKIKWILIFVSIFIIYHCISAFIFSSLPVVATSKLVSYSVVFLGVLIGVAYTKDKFNLMEWLIKWFYLIFITSIFFILHPIGYLRNGLAFQGVTNQPNLFGILSVLFISLLLTKSLLAKNSNKLHIYVSVPLVFMMLLLSDSRTALLSSVVVLLTYVLIVNWRRVTYMKIAVISFVTASLVILIPLLYPYAIEYFYKGQQQGDILLSRSNQISTLLSNFSTNPLFGTGFAVPLLPFRLYTFSDNYIVEPGNIILAVLSYGGIIGIILFIIYMFSILLSNKKQLPYNILLIMAPLLVNIGEMSFFSSNGIGILSYLFLSLYVFIEKKDN